MEVNKLKEIINNEDVVYLNVINKDKGTNREVYAYNRNELKPVSIVICTMKGKVVLDSSKLTKDVISIIENTEFVVINAEYIIRILLALGIRLKIKLDLNICSILSKGVEPIERKSLSFKDVNSYVDKYCKGSNAFKNYKYSKILEMLGYGEYFSFLNDINRDILNEDERCDFVLNSEGIHHKGRRFETNDIKVNASKYYYVSIESRSQAEIKWCNNDTLYNEPVDELDIHKEIAKLIFDKNIITKEERRKAKTFNFSRMLLNGKNVGTENLEKLYSRMMYGRVTPEGIAEFKDFSSKVLPFKCNYKCLLNESIVNSLFKLYTFLENSGLSYRDVSICYVSVDRFVFRIKNKINPYRISRQLLECFDSSEVLGYNIMDMINVGNDLNKILKESCHLEDINKEVTYIVGRIPIKFLEYMDRVDGNRKLRNNVGDFNKSLHIYKLMNQ